MCTFMYYKKAVCSGYGDLSWNLLCYVSTNPIPMYSVKIKKNIFTWETEWQTSESPSLLLKKKISDNFLSGFQSTGLRAAFQPFTKVVLKKCIAAAATKSTLDSSSKRDKGFIIVCVTFTHTQYATAHPLLQHQGSMNLFLLTKHIQARAEQCREA